MTCINAWWVKERARYTYRFPHSILISHSLDWICFQYILTDLGYNRHFACIWESVHLINNENTYSFFWGGGAYIDHFGNFFFFWQNHMHITYNWNICWLINWKVNHWKWTKEAFQVKVGRSCLELLKKFQIYLFLAWFC